MSRSKLTCDTTGFDTKVVGGYASDGDVVLKLDSPRRKGNYISRSKNDHEVSKATVEHYVRLGYIKGSTIDRLFVKVR